MVTFDILSTTAQKDLEMIRPDPSLNVIEPEKDNGSQKITNSFLNSLNGPDDTLDAFLEFLKESNSPVSSVVELRSLLLQQKEEKVALQSLVDQMRIEMQGVK